MATVKLHIWFVCRLCHRYISGCLESCPGDHKVEKVDCCAMCAAEKKQ